VRGAAGGPPGCCSRRASPTLVSAGHQGLTSGPNLRVRASLHEMKRCIVCTLMVARGLASTKMVLAVSTIGKKPQHNNTRQYGGYTTLARVADINDAIPQRGDRAPHPCSQTPIIPGLLGVRRGG